MHHAPGRTWRIALLGALFLTTSLGFAAYRHSSFAVWNDSPDVFHPPDRDEPAQSWSQAKDESWPALLPALWAITQDAFRAGEGGGYRPLAELWTGVAAFFFYDPKALPFPLLLIVGAIHGLLAVSLFAVARRFVCHDVTALLAVVLVLASPPLVASSWVCVAGLQVLVPLLFCLSLLCYWSFVEGKHRLISVVGLGLLLVLGPWVREFFGLNALLLLFLEMRRARRPTWLMGVAALGFLHAMFPTALIHWMFMPELPLQPVYRLGTLAGALGNDDVRWYAALHFLPLLPPLLWVTAGSEAIARVLGGAGNAANLPAAWLDRVACCVQVAAIPCWLVLLFVALWVQLPPSLIGVVVCLGPAALAMRRDVFLGFWYLLMFLPILRVFTEHVHFLYAIPPAAIILAQAAESLFLRLQQRPRLAWLRTALVAVVVVAAADQTMNLYGSCCVNHATYAGIDVVAGWFETNVPRGTVVVTNAIHGEEIKWHSGNHFQTYWTVSAGVNDPNRTVVEPAEMEALLVRQGPKPVYFLAVDFDYLPLKVGYHSHKYVHSPDIAKRDLGVVHFTKVRYPFLDPLRYLIPREYQPFLGAPDLVNDFENSLAASHPFCHQVCARYHVYEVTGWRRSDAILARKGE